MPASRGRCAGSLATPPVRWHCWAPDREGVPVRGPDPGGSGRSWPGCLCPASQAKAPSVVAVLAGGFEDQFDELALAQGGHPGTMVAYGRGLGGQCGRRRLLDAKVGQADQDQVGAEAPGLSLGAVALAVQRPAGPMVQDRLQPAAIVQLDRGVQAPFVLVGPSMATTCSQAARKAWSPARRRRSATVNPAEEVIVGHAIPIREDPAPGPPDGRAGPAV